jgi:hypothetical protein
VTDVVIHSFSMLSVMSFDVLCSEFMESEYCGLYGLWCDRLSVRVAGVLMG